MLKPGIKKLTAFLILLYLFLIKTGYTDADIFAERTVSHNKFSALAIDFSIKNSFNNTTINSLFYSLGIVPSGFDLGALRLKANENNKFNYRVRTITTNGDDLFCKSLRVKIFDRNFFQIYNGSLTDLSFSSRFINSNPKDFIFFISLDDQNSELKNKICEFNFDFKTYRDNPDEPGGIFAQRLINNVISSSSW